MVETKLLLAYSFNMPTYEWTCTYILSIGIYVNICPYRHAGICLYVHTVE